MVEELIYRIPFAQHPWLFITLLIVIAFIGLGFIMKMFQVPQKMMALIICGIAMTILIYFQTDGKNAVDALSALAKHQNQITEQLKTTPLQFDEISLTGTLIRHNSLTLIFVSNANNSKLLDKTQLETLTNDYISRHMPILCTFLHQEAHMPYRENYKNALNLQITDFKIVIYFGQIELNAIISTSRCKA